MTMKLPIYQHRIQVTFYDGQKANYTTAIMYGPLGLQHDPSVVEIVDLDTGDVLYQID